TITISGSITAGTFTLTFDGAIIGTPIAANQTSAALAAAIQGQLNALPTIGNNNTAVTAPSATTIAIAFQNALGGTAPPLIGFAFPTALVGGTLTAATTTTGIAAPITALGT